LDFLAAGLRRQDERTSEDLRPRRARIPLVRHWEANGLFRPERNGADPWTLVNPPPNVTGSLHIGHALDNTLQDVLVRHARLKGKDARWVVGTDHAGIATQMVVERQLNAQQQKRTDFTREEFVAKVWEWKARVAARSPAAPPPRLLDGLVRTSASRWTRASPRPCSRCSSSCTSRGCSTATSAW
jgi:leucyl-tRNA synthetase